MNCKFYDNAVWIAEYTLVFVGHHVTNVFIGHYTGLYRGHLNK